MHRFRKVSLSTDSPRHDKERMYRQGLLVLKERAREGVFTSVADFSRSFALVFADKLGSDASNFAEIIQQVSGRAEDMAPEQKELRSRARHILRACQPFLQDAIRKESELTGRPFAQQMKELDQALVSRRNSVVDYAMEDAIIESIENKANGVTGHEPDDTEMRDLEEQPDEEAFADGEALESSKGDAVTAQVGADTEPGAANPLLLSAGPPASTPPASTNGIKADHAEPAPHALAVHGVTANGLPEPPTPPMSLENQGLGQGAHPTIGYGGTPWYVEQFDPSGTTIFEERWTGQQVLREMSEELSEMDEDELQGLGDEEVMGVAGGAVEDMMAAEEADAPVANGRTTRNGKKAKARKSGGGGQWADRSFRQRRWR